MGVRVGHLIQLTWLRFVAAAVVMLVHVKHVYLLGIPDWARSILDNSFLAIGFFFVLSGFVLSYAYLASPSRPLDRRSFWVARFARVYPVYALAMLFTAPLFLEAAHSRRVILEELVLVPTMLQSWVPGMAINWNVPAWSLSVEAFLYVVFPFVAPTLMGWSTRRSLVGIVVCCWLSATQLGLDVLPATLASSMDVQMLPLVRLPEFVVGILLARIFQLHRENLRLVAVGPWLTLCSAIALFVALANVSAERELIITAVMPVLFACVVLGMAVQGGRPSVLVSRPVLLLGEASYALFLVHFGIAMWIFHIAAAVPAWAPTLLAGWFLGVYVVMSIGSSIIIYFGVERPARVALRRLLDRRAIAHRLEQVAPLTGVTA